MTMTIWQIRVDWNRSSSSFVIMAARRADAPAGREYYIAWDTNRGAGDGRDWEKIKGLPGAREEVESVASQAADLLAGQTPPHPLAAAADDAARDLEAWRRVEAMTTGHLALITDREGAGKSRARAWQAVAKLAASGSRVAMRRKFRAVDNLLAEARRQARESKSRAAYAPRPRRGAPAGFQNADL